MFDRVAEKDVDEQKYAKNTDSQSGIQQKQPKLRRPPCIPSRELPAHPRIKRTQRVLGNVCMS